MKYRPTPGNILFLIALGFFIYTKLNPGDPRDALGMAYVFTFFIFVLLADFVLQRLITNYKKLLLVEVIGLTVVIFLVLRA